MIQIPENFPIKHFLVDTGLIVILALILIALCQIKITVGMVIFQIILAPIWQLTMPGHRKRYGLKELSWWKSND